MLWFVAWPIRVLLHFSDTCGLKRGYDLNDLTQAEIIEDEECSAWIFFVCLAN